MEKVLNQILKYFFVFSIGLLNEPESNMVLEGKRFSKYF